jgi:hypothetical protein
MSGHEAFENLKMALERKPELIPEGFKSTKEWAEFWETPEGAWF